MPKRIFEIRLSLKDGKLRGDELALNALSTFYTCQPKEKRTLKIEGVWCG